MRVDFSEAVESLNRMADGFFARLPYLFAAAIVFFIFVLAARFVSGLIHRFAAHRRKHRNLGFVLSRLAQGGIILIGMLIALVIAIPTFQPGQLVQVLGLSTVAIGFAFRDVLQNFLAGIIILLTEPFKIGDQIKIDDFYGSVEDIQTRATIIKTFDRRRVVIPNAEFFTKSVIVTTAYDNRRIEHVVARAGPPAKTKRSGRGQSAARCSGWPGATGLIATGSRNSAAGRKTKVNEIEVNYE